MIDQWILENVDTQIKHTNHPDEIHICCPICDESRYRLYINTTNGLCYCHNCNFKGTVVNLIQHVEKVPYTKALFIFDQVKGNMVLPTDVVHSLEWKWLIGEPEPIKQAIPLPSEYQSLLTYKQIMAHKAVQYLESRGITEDQISQHKMGWCGYGDYANRVIIPIYERGTLKFWVARAISKKSKMKEKSPSNKEYQWSKSEVVFNLDNAARKYHTAVISEGIFDALSWGDIGISLLGKELYDEQLRTLLSYKPMLTDGLYIALDADALDNALKMAGRLKDFFQVHLITIPEEFDDPNNYLLTHSKHDMWKLISEAEEFSEFTPLYKRLQRI